MVTDAFSYLVTHPHSPLTLNSPQYQLLERYTVVIYDKSSSLEHVNEARRELYCTNNRTMKNLTPTQEALLQHGSMLHTRLVSGQQVITFSSRRVSLDLGYRSEDLATCVEQTFHGRLAVNLLDVVAKSWGLWGKVQLQEGQMEVH